jgi:hypothetical protein
VLSDEEIDDLSIARGNPGATLWNSWARRPAELIGALSRLSRGRPLAIMPFKIHVH